MVLEGCRSGLTGCAEEEEEGDGVEEISHFELLGAPIAVCLQSNSATLKST